MIFQQEWGKAKISFKGTSGESAGKTLNLKTNNIIFQNDVANEIVTFTGTSSDKNGNLWNVSGTLENFRESNNGKKITVLVSLTLTPQTSGLSVVSQADGDMI